MLTRAQRILPVVVLATVAGACQWWSAQSAQPQMPASAGKGWSAQRSAAPETAAHQGETATQFAKWMHTAAEKLAFAELDFSTYSTSTTVQDLRDLAAVYPFESSPVVEMLSGAATHIVNADVALVDKKYAKAREEYLAAGQALQPLPLGVEKDVAAVQHRTGRLVLDGRASNTGASREVTKVDRWLDGDTVETNAGTVDLIGIDAADPEGCEQGKDAHGYARVMAPPETTIALVHPDAVNLQSSAGHRLAYVELADGTDLGYSLLLSMLAIARFDSADGYQWHPREVDYRKASRVVQTLPVDCSGDPTEAFAKASVKGDEDDDDRDSYAHVRSRLRGAVGTTGRFVEWIAAAGPNVDVEDEDLPDASRGTDGGGASGWNGSIDIPDSLCPTRWC